MKIRMVIDEANMNKVIDTLIQKYHYTNKDRDMLVKVYRAMDIAKDPVAIFRGYKESMDVDFLEKETSVLVAISLGEMIDKLGQRLMREEQLEEAYVLDCIANEWLLMLYRIFNETYAKLYHRYVKKYVFIGETIPAEKIPHLLKKLTDTGEITSNEYGSLRPTKSVIFFAVITEDANTCCEGICMGCGNVNCENRMVDAKQTKPIEKKIDNANSSYGYMRIFGNKKPM